MPDIIHITSPANALKIISKGSYSTKNNKGHYDAGMNFLGVLGECSNTQPIRGCKVHCEWNGTVSAPLKYDAYDYHTPNILFDFNGSGNHFPNNDPRYFLPYCSKGVIVKRIELEENYDKCALAEQWAQLEGGIFPSIYKCKFFRGYVLRSALKALDEINERLATEKTTISVVYG